MLPISKTRPDIFSCGSMLQCITEEVKKQAERQIKSRFLMYVPGVHNLPLKITSKGSTFWTHCRTAKTQEKREMAGIPTRSRIAERSWSATSRTRSIKGACTKNDTGNPTWKNLTEQQVQPGSTSILLQSGAYCRGRYKVVQPCQGGGGEATP